MNIGKLVILATGLILSGTTFAKDGEALAKIYNCMMCHAVTDKSTGPTFKAVAAKYSGDKKAQTKLEKKTRSGGAGEWGNLPMPATARSVPDEDIKEMVRWILTLK